MIKIWPCGSDEELGGEKAKKKGCFGGETQKEQRGTVGGDQEETKGWACSPRAHVDIDVRQQRAEQGELVLSPIKPVLHVG